MSNKQLEWDYRIVRSNKEDGTPADWYSIQEVYYDDDGNPNAQTMDLQVEGENKDEMRKQLQEMLFALEDITDRGVVAEIKSNIDNHKGTDFTPPQSNVVNNMLSEIDDTDDLQGDHGLEINSQSDNSSLEMLRQKLLNLEIENSDLKQIIREKDKQIEEATRGI